MHRHPAALLHDGVDRRRQRAHVVPMAMGHRDAFDLAERNAEIGAVADENRPLRTGVEQQRVLHAAGAATPAASP